MSLVRNSDSWRIATPLDTVGDHRLVIGAAGQPALWHERDVQTILPGDLDRALMKLRESHPFTYDTFLAVMLGEDQ